MDPVEPDWDASRLVACASGADIERCWACSSCDLECPINIATHMLRPQKLVRMANWGLFEELLCAPEIWYCLECRHCAQICPNSVKPSSVVGYIRREALSRGVVSWRRFKIYCDLLTRFQRARWRAVKSCMRGKIPEVTEKNWQEWITAPPARRALRTIAGNAHAAAFFKYGDLFQQTKGAQCLTCGECSSACPVSGHSEIFDPRKLIRMVQLGLVEEAAALPDIWLCLSCGRCSDACSQQVDGRAIVEHLRRIAIARGIVGNDFKYLVEQADRNLYPWFLDDVDRLICGEPGRAECWMETVCSGAQMSLPSGI